MTWTSIDTAIVLTSALTAMACALPGNFLVLRRMSMMGDALSHAMLPGIAIAFLATHALLSAGLIDMGAYLGLRHAAMFTGAVVLGVLTGVVSQAVTRLGRVEASAALGVVFTTFFAMGILLIRVAADRVHLDPDCFLYGTVELAGLDAPTVLGVPLPTDAVINGGVLLANMALLAVFYKELKVSTFDPALATTLGVNAGVMHYALMAVTAATLVAAFESVGSILVIAMLIVPPAAAHLLTDRLGVMIALSLAIAAASAVLGHIAAITLPELVFNHWLGYSSVRDASTTGMMAVTAGGLFALAALFGPRHGVVSKAWRRARLSLRILREDVLGLLYRMEERRGDERLVIGEALGRVVGARPLLGRLAVARLRSKGMVASQEGQLALTDAGRREATRLVRTHRLWESYLFEHLPLAADHLHAPAEKLEHVTDEQMQRGLADAMDRPTIDPHGRPLPPETE